MKNSETFSAAESSNTMMQEAANIAAQNQRLVEATGKTVQSLRRERPAVSETFERPAPLESP